MYPTVLGTFGFGDPDPGATLAAWVESAGVRAVQAYRNPDNEPTVEQMLAWASAAGLRFDSLHGVFGPAFDPSSPDEAVRAFAVDTYQREAELVRRLGGDMVVVHPSPPVEGYDGHDRQQRLGQLQRSIDQLSEIGQSAGVRFLIENQPPWHPVGADTAELAGLVRSCRRPAVGFCFDTGHAHLAGDELAALRAVGSLLEMVHASDNSGRSDDHMLCFEGTVDWPGIGRELNRMRFDGAFVLEVFLRADQVRLRATDGWAARLRETMGLLGRAGSVPNVAR